MVVVGVLSSEIFSRHPLMAVVTQRMNAEIAIRHFQSLDAFVADEWKLHNRGPRFSDLDAPCLIALPNLKHLVLTETAFTDAALPLVEGLTRLQILDLNMTAVTDAIATILPQLKSLRTLGLYGPRITDSTLVAIADLPDLQMLNIRKSDTADFTLRAT